MTIPEAIIVVEGRDDTKRLIEAFGPLIRTVETNGSAVSRSVIARIQALAKEYPIIIFTDPDYQGERIRRIVAEAVPQARHAYLTQSEAYKNERSSLGIEHASPKIIRQAIANVPEITLGEALVTKVPLAKLAELGLTGAGAKRLRERVAAHFHLGHVNAKTLQRQLQRYGIDSEKLIAYIEKEMRNEHE